MLAHFLFVLCFLIINGSNAISLENKMNELKDSLQQLQNALQQSSSTQRPPYKRPPITPTATPLWDRVKGLYEDLLEIKIRNIQDEELKNQLSNLFLLLHYPFNNFVKFEQALKNFINFTESNEGNIREPEEFIQLVKAFDSFLGSNTVNNLKGALVPLASYVNDNPHLNQNDRNIAIDFLKTLSAILNTLAGQVAKLKNEIIIPADRINRISWQPETVRWPLKARELDAARNLSDWFTAYISYPLEDEGYAYGKHPLGQHNPNGLNMKYINTTISALQTIAPQPQQQHVPPPAQQIIQSPENFLEIISIFSNRFNNINYNEIHDRELKKIILQLVLDSLDILNNLYSFGAALDEFGQVIKSQSGKIQEPDEYVELVNQFNEFFGRDKINNLKDLVQRLINYRMSNDISDHDKTIAMQFLMSLSDLLNQIYNQVDQFFIQNKKQLDSIMWKEGRIQERSSIKTLAYRDAYRWIDWYILSPLYINARARQDKFTNPSGRNLNEAILYDAIGLFKQ